MIKFIKQYKDNSGSVVVDFNQAFKELVPFYKDSKMLRQTLHDLKSGQSMGSVFAVYRRI